MTYENPLIVDSGDSILSSTGYWAPTSSGNSVSDPLAGRWHVSTSVNTLVYVRRPTSPDVEVVSGLAMSFNQAVAFGRLLVQNLPPDAVEVDVRDGT